MPPYSTPSRQRIGRKARSPDPARAIRPPAANTVRDHDEAERSRCPNVTPLEIVPTLAGIAVALKPRPGFAGTRHIFLILTYRCTSGSDLTATSASAAPPTAMVIAVT
jgi:hypothetical protein